MILKAIKIVVISGIGLGVAGGVLFGTELGSYVTSSIHTVQDAARDAVPIDFELKRARDMLNDIVPEMQANIKVIAQQEVAISNLKTDIDQSTRALADEQTRVQTLRQCLSSSNTRFTLSGITYPREQVKDELARRFDRYKEAEVVLAGKQRLLENREKALAAGMQMLERARSQKTLLESKIESLQAQFRMVQAASVGSKVAVDNSKLAQTEKLIAQIKTQLDVAERVLAHESRFTEPMKIDVVDEQHLVAAIDDHFTAEKPEAPVDPETRVSTLAPPASR